MHSSGNKPVNFRRAPTEQWALKPQDWAVALKLVADGKARVLAYSTIARQMELSSFEVHAAMRRLTVAKLLTLEADGAPKLALNALFGFMVYGAPYCFPVVDGEEAVGVPTACDAPPLKDVLPPRDGMPTVWPHAAGTVKGRALQPLYANLPRAALAEPRFYALLALFDALRVGAPAERELAVKLIKERFREA